MKKTRRSQPSLTRPKPAPLHKPLPVDKLRWHCDPKSLKVKTSDEIKPSREIIGQERALRAPRGGLAVQHFAYNNFFP